MRFESLDGAYDEVRESSDYNNDNDYGYEGDFDAGLENDFTDTYEADLTGDGLSEHHHRFQFRKQYIQ